MSRYASSYSSAGVAVGSYERPEQSVSTIMNNISKVLHLLHIDIRFSHMYVYK